MKYYFFILLGFVNANIIEGQYIKLRFDQQFLLSSCIFKDYNIDRPEIPNLSYPLEYLGYSTTFYLEKTINNRFNLITGIGYKSIGFKGYATPNSIITKIKYQEDFKQIRIPVLLKYIPILRWNNFSIQSGFSSNIRLSRNEIITKWYDNGTKSTEPNYYDRIIYKLINFSWLFGVGYDIHLSDKWGISLNPMFEIDMMGTAVDYLLIPHQWFYYSAGISFGLTLKN